MHRRRLGLKWWQGGPWENNLLTVFQGRHTLRHAAVHLPPRGRPSKDDWPSRCGKLRSPDVSPRPAHERNADAGYRNKLALEQLGSHSKPLDEALGLVLYRPVCLKRNGLITARYRASPKGP